MLFTMFLKVSQLLRSVIKKSKGYAADLFVIPVAIDAVSV